MSNLKRYLLDWPYRSARDLHYGLGLSTTTANPSSPHALQAIVMLLFINTKPWSGCADLNRGPLAPKASVLAPAKGGSALWAETEKNNSQEGRGART